MANSPRNAKRTKQQPRNSERSPNRARNTKQTPKQPSISARRENWSRFGYVSVLRSGNGRIRAWQKWSPNRPKKTVIARYQQRITQRGPKDAKTAKITYISEKYQNVNKVVSKGILKGEVGQIMRVFRAQKDKRVISIEGFSYLGDPGNYRRYREMLEEAERSARSYLPFSPDSWEEILHRRRVIYFFDKQQAIPA